MAGSIGGLFAAALLRRVGWQVDVYERSAADLHGRGAGIVTHAELIDALEVCGASSKDLGMQISGRVGYNRAGDVIESLDLPQWVTSWNRLHTVIRATLPDAHYHLGCNFEKQEPYEGGVRASFANGRTTEAELLVGADGFRSSVRGQMHPLVQPACAGYVVWRGVAPEVGVVGEVDPAYFDTMDFFLPEITGVVIGYPIAGANNDVRPGHRQYNWVWNQVIDQETLDDMLIDVAGKQHNISIPPPLIRPALIEKMRRDAEKLLPYPFARILREVAEPFFTPIYDLASPTMVDGNVALVGDAAFVVRPHCWQGRDEGGCGRQGLAECLDAAAGDVTEGLGAFNSSRM